MIEVTLTPKERKKALEIAHARQTQNLAKGRKDRYGAKKTNGLSLHETGAMGEAALAKFCNIKWDGSLGNLKAKDVGNLQVRTRTKDEYKGEKSALILQPRDKDDDIFVMAIYEDDKAYLAGWIRAGDGKIPDNWKDYAWNRPAYFVPRDQLNPMETLEY